MSEKSPRVVRFSAEPARPDGLAHNRRHLVLTRGAEAMLTWKVEHASKVTLDQGIGEQIATAKGVKVAPKDAETTYHIVAIARSGVRSKPATVSISLKDADDIISPVVIVQHPEKVVDGEPNDDEPEVSEVEDKAAAGIKISFKHKFKFDKKGAAAAIQDAEEWFETEGAASVEVEGALNPDAETTLTLGKGDAAKGVEHELEGGDFFKLEGDSFWKPVKLSHKLTAKFFNTEEKGDWTIASIGGALELTFGEPEFGKATGELEAVSIKRKEGKWSVEVAEVGLEGQIIWKGKREVEWGKYKGELEGLIAAGLEFKVKLNLKKVALELAEKFGEDLLVDVAEGVTGEVFLGIVAETVVFALPFVVFGVVMYELFSIWKDWQDVHDVQERYEDLRRGFHEGLWATLENYGKKPSGEEPDKEDAYGQGKKQGMEAGEKYWAIIFDGDKKKGTKGIHQKFMESKAGNKWYWDKRRGQGESDPDIDLDLLKLVLWGLKKNGSIDTIVRDAMRRIEEKLRHDLYLAFVKTHDDHWYKEPGWMPRDTVFQYLYRTEIEIDDYDQPGVPDDVYEKAIIDAWYLRDKKGTGKKGRKQRVPAPPADGQPLPPKKKKDQFEEKKIAVDVKPAKKKPAPPPPPPPEKQEPPKKKSFRNFDDALDAAGWIWANEYTMQPGGEPVYFQGSPPPAKIITAKDGFAVVDPPPGATFTSRNTRGVRTTLPTLQKAMEAQGWKQAIRGSFDSAVGADPTFGWLEYRNGKAVTENGGRMAGFITEVNGEFNTNSPLGSGKFRPDKGADAIVSA